MQQWQGDVNKLLAEPRASNRKAQRHLRELKNSQDRAGKMADILVLIDKGLGAVMKLLPV